MWAKPAFQGSTGDHIMTVYEEAWKGGLLQADYYQSTAISEMWEMLCSSCPVVALTMQGLWLGYLLQSLLVSCPLLQV
jgi:hypothetical protein